MHRFLKLLEEVGLLHGVLAGLQVLLVPILGLREGVVLETDCDLRDTEALVTTNLFNLSLCTDNPLKLALILNAVKGPDLGDS